jgi:hypothetical protein
VAPKMSLEGESLGLLVCELRGLTMWPRKCPLVGESLCLLVCELGGLTITPEYSQFVNITYFLFPYIFMQFPRLPMWAKSQQLLQQLFVYAYFLISFCTLSQRCVQSATFSGNICWSVFHPLHLSATDV